MKKGLSLVQTLCDSQKTRRQIVGQYVHVDPNGKIDGYCAMGSLFCESERIEDNNTYGGELDMLVYSYGIDGGRAKKEMKCPKCDQKRDLSKLIIHLNDIHRFTFKHIAAVLKKKGF